MEIPIELEEKINRLFKMDAEMRDKLLNADVEAIRKLSIISEKGIDPKKVVELYESNNLNILYEEAKRLIEINKLYHELVEYYQNSRYR